MKSIDSIDALRTAITKAVPALLWLAADEPLLGFEAGDLMRSTSHAQGFVDRVIIDVGAGFDGSELVGLVQARSLFGERRLIDIRLGPRTTKDFGEWLARAAHGIDADTRLMLTGPAPDRTQQRAAWFKAIDPALVLVRLARIDERAFPRWLRDRLQQARLSIEDEAFALLVERTQGNPVAADQAIRRFALLGPHDRALDAATVDEIVQDSAHYEVFALVDVALRGDAAQSLRIVDNLRAADAPLPLLAWALGDAMRKLLKVHAARARGDALPQALRSVGAFGTREVAYRQALLRLDARTTLALLRETAWLDKLSKGVAAGIGVTIDATAATGRGSVSVAGGTEAGFTAGAANPWSAVERIVAGILAAPRLAP